MNLNVPYKGSPAILKDLRHDYLNERLYIVFQYLEDGVLSYEPSTQWFIDNVPSVKASVNSPYMVTLANWNNALDAALDAALEAFREFEGDEVY